MEQEFTKKCPYCSEIILETAKKCKHCGEFLVDMENKAISKQSPTSYNSETLGIFLLIVPVISIFLFLFFGDVLILMILASVGNVILTAILATVEASNLGIGRNTEKKRETGPAGWFFCFLLLWLIAYPAYLYKRSKYGLKNYCAIGILIALVYIFTAGACGTMYMWEKHELAVWVKSSLTENIAKDPDYAGLEVGEVSLVRESLHKFTGLVEYSWNGQTENVSVVVTVDGNQRIYQCEPPRVLIMKKKLQTFN